MDTVMRIECASNLVCHVHMNLLEIQCTSNAHHINSTLGGGLNLLPIHLRRGLESASTSGGGLEADSNLLLFKIHTRLCLFVLLIFLACGMCYIAIFSFALTATLGKKEACFLMAEKSSTAL